MKTYKYLSSEDLIILRGWMLKLELHICILKIRIMWPRLAILPKSPDRSASVLLRSQLQICLIQAEELSAQ